MGIPYIEVCEFNGSYFIKPDYYFQVQCYLDYTPHQTQTTSTCSQRNRGNLGKNLLSKKCFMNTSCFTCRNCLDRSPFQFICLSRDTTRALFVQSWTLPLIKKCEWLVFYFTTHHPLLPHCLPFFYKTPYWTEHYLSQFSLLPSFG